MTDILKNPQELVSILGPENVLTENEATSRYAVDGLIPQAVVFPSSPEQIAEVVRFARRENLSITPWGGGSKITWGNPPKRLDMVLCTSRLNRITDIDWANLTVTLEAGVRFKDIQGQLASEENRCYLPLDDTFAEKDDEICSDRQNKGCFVPLDPPYMDLATMGGILASNSNGPRQLLYGMPRDLVLGVRFVTPGGEIIGAGGKTVKNVSGYDISKLMIGSSGTLGILCEMTLRLLPLPEMMETLLISFASLSEASAFAGWLIDCDLLPAAVEIMNGSAFRSLEFDGAPQFDSAAYVAAVSLEGFQDPVLRMRKEILEMAKKNGSNGEGRIEEDQHRMFWRSVSNLEPRLAEQKSGLITAHLTYPLSAWTEIAEFAAKTLSEKSIDYTVLIHAGNGSAMINLLLDSGDAGKEAIAADAVQALLNECVAKNGNMTIRRSPGQMKSKLPVWGELRSDFVLMKRIKEQLDPSSLMSPGRFVGGL